MTARGPKRSPSGSVMPFAPMEPILSPALPRDPSYAFQVKWDGVRLVADVGPDGVRLWSKNGRDVTVAFPELVAALKPLGNRRRWLDGEAIVLDHAGRSSFSDAVRRIRVRDAAAAQQYARTWPACYAVFDCLRDGETVLFAEAWEARQEYLHNLIPVNSQALFAVETVRDGEALWNRVLAQGEEGVVAKRRQGRYVPGKTHGDWLKVKACREGVFAIVGLAEWAGASVPCFSPSAPAMARGRTSAAWHPDSRKRSGGSWPPERPTLSPNVHPSAGQWTASAGSSCAGFSRIFPPACNTAKRRPTAACATPGW